MNVNVWSFGGEHPRRRFIIWPAGASSAFPQHVQNDSQGRRIGTGCDSEAVARHQNKFQSHTRAGSLRAGVHQREPNGTLCRQPFPPVIEGLIAETVLATERAH